MIIVVTTTEKNEKTGHMELLASHGVEELTGRQLVLPAEHPKEIGAHYSDELQSWVIHP
ncbi:hypothetical protein [Leclercia adecarboxylata]|uniref:hypothetical protein n=1 Tax=Leclercia adecarboxylata TaxID=83655 RepID=UPI0013DFB3C3|nr:hypothetical protein [Leclercia adecarboxylata]MDU1652688.1 hypothetical protein [Leclercia adecarboxylata]